MCFFYCIPSNKTFLQKKRHSSSDFGRDSPLLPSTHMFENAILSLYPTLWDATHRKCLSSFALQEIQKSELSSSLSQRTHWINLKLYYFFVCANIEAANAGHEKSSHLKETAFAPELKCKKRLSQCSQVASLHHVRCAVVYLLWILRCTNFKDFTISPLSHGVKRGHSKRCWDAMQR